MQKDPGCKTDCSNPINLSPALVLRAQEWAFLSALIILRILYIFTTDVDSDEPQYLHVIWGWSNHYLQYRDIFDNHTPLFFILVSPLFSLLGDRPDILIWMRLLMLPLYLLMLWEIYVIACLLFSQHVARWTVVFTALYPLFFLTTAEFRPDNLWVVFWLMLIAFVLQKDFTIKRLFLFGLITGAAFGTSMKSFLLLPSLILAYWIVNILQGRPWHAFDKNFMAKAVVAGFGFLIIPSGIILYFSSQYALGNLYYCVIQHNIVPGLGSWSHVGREIFLFVDGVIFLILGVCLINLNTQNKDLRGRRLLVFITLMLTMLFFCFWPIVSKETTIAVIPLIIIFSTPLILGYINLKKSLAIIPVLVMVLELGSIFLLDKPTNKVNYGINFLKEVLKLTSPEDVVMDTKGETIFRKRAFYYCLEKITKKRLFDGSIKDTELEDMIRHHASVVVDYNNEYTSRTNEFIHNNYVPLGMLYVAGKVLPAKPGQEINFDIMLPEHYVLVSRKGTVSGELDGRSYQGTRFLEKGKHTFRLDSSYSGEIVLIWAQAIERGFSPFMPKDDNV